MATKNRTKKFDGVWRGFMDIPLTSTDKENCLSWDAEGASLEEQLEFWVRGGYKLSISWNEKTQSLILAATGQEKAGSNAGYTLSAHAKDLAKASHVLLYKHMVMAEGDWHREGLYQNDEDFG